MTVHLIDTFKKRNPYFEYNSAINPKRVLTKPSKPCKNDGYDNEHSDYILCVHDYIGHTDDEERYVITDLLGSGTFGQVVKCRDTLTNEMVGIKVIKNKPAYTKQSLIEVDILEYLNHVSDPYDEHNILRLYDSFMFRNHLCLVFELLSINLYELLKQNHFKGFSIFLVRLFATQLLDALIVTRKESIIHCDLKPENILLRSLDESSLPEIKVIDFGSACYESEQSYSYIQSRFYRSPEVLLGLPYTTAIDMWSFGCIVAELYLGLPLFPGSSEYNQLTRIIETAGNIPDYMIRNGKYGHRYYNRRKIIDPITGETSVSYRLKGLAQYSEERNKLERNSKRYFSTYVLDELVLKYPFSSHHHHHNRPQDLERDDEESSRTEDEIELRFHLLHFLKRVLEVDPSKRLTPEEAMEHPFIANFNHSKSVASGQDETMTRSPEAVVSISSEDVNDGDDDDGLSMLTGLRRKSYANTEARSSLSISPFSRKRFESLQRNLLLPSSPPPDPNQDMTLLQPLSSVPPTKLDTRLRLRRKNNSSSRASSDMLQCNSCSDDDGYGR
ncbi:MAG: kinase-like domain-containing protein [Benjaminiella poitrasii]|nr:MAG: kinase-like domain-containing protein [Benjaminiella poitrasii]